MNLGKFGKYSAFFAVILVLLAVPAYAPMPFSRAYPAEITVNGKLTLTSFKDQTADPMVLTLVGLKFSSLVPEIIPKGEHEDVEFNGWAVGPDKNGFIKFEGLMTLTLLLESQRKIPFWVKFVVEKPQDVEIPWGIYGVGGSELSITIADLTLPPDEITWILMKGNVSEFTAEDSAAGEEAFGHLVAHAKISEDNNWTKVNGVFSTEPPAAKDTNEFTRSFYVVTLANNEATELNGGLRIEGTWNVHKRTITVVKTEGGETTITITLTPIAEKETGTLTATFTASKTPWQAEGNFVLTIDTFGMIEGDVVFFHTKFGRPFERGIPRADFNGDRRVDILDIVRLARAFRAKLGSQRYGFDLDVAPGGEPDSPGGPDLEVNIIDIAAAAKEFGQEY